MFLYSDPLLNELESKEMDEKTKILVTMMEKFASSGKKLVVIMDAVNEVFKKKRNVDVFFIKKQKHKNSSVSAFRLFC